MRVCMFPAITFALDDFYLDISRSGSSRHYLGQVRRLSSQLKVHGLSKSSATAGVELLRWLTLSKRQI